MIRSRRFAASLLLLALTAVPSRADQPRVSLSLKRVTAEQAVQALTEKAGTPVRLYTADQPPNANPEPVLVRPADFEWTNVTFGTALRQVCARYELRPVRSQSGYVLYPNPQPAAAPKRFALVEKEGVKLFARSLSLFENRQLQFLNGAGDPAVSGSLQLYFGAELADLDAESIANVQNVVAKDDLGNVLGQQSPGYSHFSSDSAFPDEWSGSVPLPLPHPRARKLVSVEGDLLAYRKVRQVRVEIPLPLNGKSARKELGDLVFWVGDTRPAPQAPDEEPEPLLRGQEGQAPKLTLRIRVYSPAQGAPQSRWGWGVVPYLVGASGRIYQPQQLPGSESGSDGVRMVQQHVLSFPNLNEPPARLVWDLLDRSDPVKLLSFKLTDIPLPAPREFNPREAAPAPAPEEKGDHPFYLKGGGTLVSPVVLPIRPAPGTLLDLGLAVRSGAGWGPVRWTQLELSEGTARLENIKPGTYRVVRRYRGISPAGPGSWTGTEQQVTLVAGKEARVAPLQWAAGKAPKAPAPTR